MRRELIDKRGTSSDNCPVHRRTNEQANGDPFCNENSRLDTMTKHLEYQTIQKTSRLSPEIFYRHKKLPINRDKDGMATVEIGVRLVNTVPLITPSPGNSVSFFFFFNFRQGQVSCF